MNPSARDFRLAMGHFATGVTVVTMRNAAGEAHGLTANSLTSVSLDPPLVLVCVERGIQSHAAMVEARGFLVNILAADQEELCRRFATPDIDKFEGLDLDDGPYAAPRIPGCIAYLGVRPTARHEAGDHDIFVAEVTDLETAGGSPLVFYRGMYGTTSAD